MKKAVMIFTVAAVILGTVFAVDRSRAKDLAVAQLEGADRKDIFEFDADFDDGRLEYEGTIYFEGMEYEFEIDGMRNRITKWDAEPVWN